MAPCSVPINCYILLAESSKHDVALPVFKKEKQNKGYDVEFLDVVHHQGRCSQEIPEGWEGG